MLFDYEYFFQHKGRLGSSSIKKESTKMRETMRPSERIAVTLQSCVTADAQTNIAAS